MTWINLFASAVSALMGGFIGGWVVAFRFGRMLQRLEDQVEANSQRLTRGDKPVGDVPILKTRIEVILEELREMKAQLRQDMAYVREDVAARVTHTECDRRHESDGS